VADIRILLVDDHAVFRESVARLLAAEGGLQVIRHCASVAEALAILRQERVDIVLLDFDLGEGDGSHFMQEAKRQGFAGKVLVVTAGVEEDEAVELIHAGVAGIFMKHESAALLVQSIREVMAGKAVFEQALLTRAVTRGNPSRSDARTARFTLRERQVFSGVLDGLANKEIAGRIGVSESSVKATLQQLFGKTGVRTRSQLVRIALEQHKEWGNTLR
jgi:two-component system, NarL family, nitrate/nitrite response regulator NarL